MMMMVVMATMTMTPHNDGRRKDHDDVAFDDPDGDGDDDYHFDGDCAGIP